MCSILGILDIQATSSEELLELRIQALEQSKLQRHRGPDWSGIYVNDEAILVHERLAIVDINNGAQPLHSKDKAQVLAVNGEIYNHQRLKHNLKTKYVFETESDCEIILALYQEKGLDFLNDLQGMFAFVLYDAASKSYLIARDPIGIIPLYYGYDQNGRLQVASEMKALTEHCQQVKTFPPGHFLFKDGKAKEEQLEPAVQFKKYYRPEWTNYPSVKNETADHKEIRKSLIESVKKHLMTDVPYGVLLSGGLDSSIIAAIAKQFIDKRIEDNDQSKAWWPSLHTFAVGLEGAPDLKAAQKVADHIGSIHHSLTYTVQEGLDAVKDVIYHLETYDVTTIRASTPMYLMARKIRAMGIKMVLSGEGADELFGGYLYFHKVPNAKEFHQETVRKLEKLHYYDCLRANKSMAAWGVEARVPFLDRKFIDTAMTTNPAAKMINDKKIEKHILRQAFADFLPDEIAWRQKEQFSDGVGYSWIDSLKSYAAKIISEQELATAEKVFPFNTPQTSEGYWYRKIFSELFSSEAASKTVLGGKSVACSTPEALAWDKSFENCIDPSGRAATAVHNTAYQL